ncbi:transcriptional regulator, GntR family [Lachnospiraceae bacterium KM106-2]|nr:transcriptional regulator, GntR family [Lachnospiraceae bacterium KM106-2]
MQFKKDVPIYIQIAGRIKEQIMNGELVVGDKLKSVREYSVEYEVSALTVQRAMQYLDQEQIIYSKKGVGSFVKDGVREFLKKDLIEKTAREFIEKMHHCGLSAEEIVVVVKQILNDEGEA